MASSRKTRATRRIAGIKLPKGYRRAADGIVRLSRNPWLREVTVAGLVAAATALARSRTLRARAGRIGTRLHRRRGSDVPASPRTAVPIGKRGAMPYVS